MEWEDLSKDAREVMSELGGFATTSNVNHRTVKGYIDIGEIYYDSDDLCKMASAME